MEHFCFEPHMGENWFTYPHLYSQMVKTFPSGSHFIELGSWKGMSAAFMAVEIINSGKNIKFDCIDIWSEQPYLTDTKQDLLGLDLMNRFLENTKPVSHIINAIRSDSVVAAENYADKSVDFVFIDGDHSYEGCLRDIQAWLPKMKPNSILAGHDYAWHAPIQEAVKTVFGEGRFDDPWGGGCFLLEIKNNVPHKYSPDMFVYEA
jgi:predicted O-methyltransferase YrrM